VVDDDGNVRHMMARMLEGPDLAILEAANAMEALDQCARYPVAVLVTDIRMPHMNGLELGQRVAATWPRVQLLFVTGCPEADPDSVAHRILTKPFDPDEFAAIVRSLADNYRQESEPDAGGYGGGAPQ
jgi:DNA-binding response OmpR family regulator